ncbi:MAG: FkbM family methyltransferase [Clostridiales bacterium]|nr:FkbM family methyltransferase [Clostridiales bacterium]
MDKQTEQSIYEILHTMDEALAHLQLSENEELRQLLQSGRQAVTETLDGALDCSLSQRIDADQLSDADWVRTAYRIMEEISDPFEPRNAFDRKFVNLLGDIWSHSRRELFLSMVHDLKKLQNTSTENYEGLVEYFARFPFWGTLDPKSGDYNTLELRAAVLKRHSYDFLWLYRRLEDYLSKRTLYAILKNWASLDFAELALVRSIFPDYWEPDIFPDNHDDVFVDVGAYIGDSIVEYLNMYGKDYQKIYAYEISPDSYDQLCQNIAANKLSNVVTRRKGVGRSRGELFVDANQTDASANQLRDQQKEAGQKVEVVPLDEDLEDVMTFLKMDIEGAEQDALLGCEQTIRQHHPKLAICVYHGYEDLWKIPSMIDRMYPGYKFYLRHYGGNLIPTEFVLLCKP